MRCYENGMVEGFGVEPKVCWCCCNWWDLRMRGFRFTGNEKEKGNVRKIDHCGCLDGERSYHLAQCL
ncbi:hypothetical protein LguiA_034775 [Lonicera macranthoides]